ncbi:MAG: T9SS type A sorting domain-containing protein [Candidatus Azobacteroides sp.]|nr:T9SS type A sorting domain-containing protein [Candidatus Azobacteroides sp.]
MKTKILVLIALLSYSAFLKGQNYAYIPYVAEDTRWSYAYVHRIGSGAGNYEVDYSLYQLKGDTIISGSIYKKLLYDCSENCIAVLREDNKKVFIKEQQQDERLFYDFDLQEGDWVGNLYQVTKIDTIRVGETKRKRFVFNSGYETWIEGIGALEDFYPLQGRLLGYEAQGINYQKRNSEIAYKTDEWYFNENECKGADIRSPLPPLDYFVQVKDDVIHIRLLTKKRLQATLNDLAGKLYYHSSFASTTDVIIPSLSFPKGVYLLKIFDADKNQIKVSKIVL